jgi:O-antigen/teichoic acid export membrane protein
MTGPSATRRVARNTVLTLAGQGAPLAVAYFAIPPLTHQLGADRFGILTLGWAVLGYFSLFDFGIGRALVKVVAEQLSAELHHEIPRTVWTSVLVMLVFGLVGTAISAGISSVLVRRILTVPAALQDETIQSFYILAASIPVVIITAGFRGMLEAAHRFDLSNALRVPTAVSFILGPLVTLPFTHSLVVIFAVLLALRILTLGIYAATALMVYPRVRRERRIHWPSVRPLLQLGSWMTVTSVIGPFLVNVDRFVIGSVLSVGAVTYYAAPFEAVTKMWVLPSALTTVLFPVFSSVDDTADRAGALYRRSIAFVLLTLFPVALLVMAFAREGLHAWLGPEFATRSTWVVRWLTIGVLWNSAAMIPYSLILGRGRPVLTAKLHMAELFPYLALMWFCIQTFGITGAAIAWSARTGIDAFLLFFFADRMQPTPRRFRRGGLAALALVVGALALAAAPVSLGVRIGIVLCGGPLVMLGILALLLDREDRTALGRFAGPATIRRWRTRRLARDEP